MNITSIQPQIDASQLPLESLAGNPNIPETQKVAEVSRQFEAMLLRQILQEVRKPLLDPSESNSTTTAIYNDMINNQLADSISRAGGFGLAQSLQSQLSHQVLGQTPAATATPPISPSSPDSLAKPTSP